jgi:hypothetical protein
MLTNLSIVLQFLEKCNQKISKTKSKGSPLTYSHSSMIIFFIHMMIKKVFTFQAMDWASPKNMQKNTSLIMVGKVLLVERQSGFAFYQYPIFCNHLWLKSRKSVMNSTTEPLVFLGLLLTRVFFKQKGGYGIRYT